MLRFRAPVAAAAVLAEVGRQSVRGDVAGNAGLWSADRVAAEDEEVPADVVAEAVEPLETNPVLGRPPVLIAAQGLDPLDERVLNPIGFRAVATGPATPLPDDAVLSEALVADFRCAAAVPVGWPPEPDLDRARTVAGLAMTGVPLTGDGAAGLGGGPARPRGGRRAHRAAGAR